MLGLLLNTVRVKKKWKCDFIRSQVPQTWKLPQTEVLSPESSQELSEMGTSVPKFAATMASQNPPPTQ